MIDVKELRIGNYVFPKNDSGKESVIGEIFAINDYLVSIKGNHNQYDYHLLEPIPLTEELLLKCGFTELYSDSKGYIYSVNNIEFIRSYFDTPSYFIKTNEENVLFEKPIIYLQQLQNIYFALIGKELEVNL